MKINKVLPRERNDERSQPVARYVGVAESPATSFGEASQPSVPTKVRGARATPKPKLGGALALDRGGPRPEEPEPGGGGRGCVVLVAPLQP